MTSPAGRLKALYDELVELDADTLHERLAQLEAGEAPLAAELRAMLGDPALATDRFGHAVLGLLRSAVEPAGFAPGADFAGFRIVRELGHGGMGVVYLAERRLDGATQQVALKLLRARILHPAALQGFVAERRIMARLQHPHIAALVDAGASADGTPFLAMEYIDGLPLLRYAEERALPRAARLELFLAILGAVQFAHSRAVVHRDIKPGNILVTHDGLPKLLDFGIAKLLDDEAHDTATRERAYTPDYASPEQRGGGIVTTQSDLYSLGVVLHELLLDARPDPQATRRRTLPRDLVRILDKALAENPSERYDSAAALAEDLRAHLAGAPLRHAPEARGERLRKFLRRHALAAGVSITAVLALIALAAGAALSAQRLQHERDRAEAAANKARTEAAKSEHVAGFVRSIFSGLDPDVAKARDRTLLRGMLDDASRRAQAELATEPEVLAAIEDTIGRAYRHLGEREAARAHVERALALYEKHLGPSARPSLRMASVLNDLYADGGEFETALGHAQALRATALEAYGEDDRETLYAETQIGTSLWDLGRDEEAAAQLEKTLARQRRVLGEDHGDTLNTAQTLALSLVYRDPGRSLALLEDVIERRSGIHGRESYDTLHARQMRAILFLEAGRFADIEPELRELLDSAERRTGENSSITQLAISHLAGALRNQGKIAESGPYYQRALDIARALWGEDNVNTASAALNLGNYHRAAGDPERAAQLQCQALDMVLRNRPGNHHFLAKFRADYGQTLIALRRYDEAETQLKAALDSIALAFGPGHPLQAEVETDLERLGEARGRASAGRGNR